MRYAICLLLASAAGSSFAATIAEPITGGTADLIPSSLGSTSGVERFSLFGADFTFTGTADQLSSFYACGPVIVCPPGTAVPGLSGDIGTMTGVPVSGTISFQGASYDYTAVPGSSNASLTLPFEMTTPGSDPNRTITLTGPFHGAASFLDPNFASGTSFIFPGQGTVTANLVLTGNPEVCCRYELQSLHFDFVNVPEPGTFALLGAAFLGWRMGQRGRDRSGADCRLKYYV